MDRRLIGVAVLLSAVLGVVVLSGVHGRIAPGRPIAAPVPDPPSVGDCATTDVSVLSTEATQDSRPSLTLETCDGSRYGEVVLVFTDATLSSADVGAPSDGHRLDCYGQALAYLGAGPVGAPQYGIWQTPALLMGTELVGPNIRQRASGQTWVACVVYASNPTGMPAGPLAGSVHDILQHRSPDTARFGQCIDKVGGELVSCSEQHQVELFGRADFPTPVPDLATLRQPCLDLVAVQTRIPDPTVKGRLTVGVGIDPNSTVAYQDGSTGQVVQCTVTPTDPNQALTSTLIQLGSEAPPLR